MNSAGERYSPIDISDTWKSEVNQFWSDRGSVGIKQAGKKEVGGEIKEKGDECGEEHMSGSQLVLQDGGSTLERVLPQEVKGDRFLR